MVSIPAAIPVTKSPETDALELLLLHKPSVTRSDKVMVEPTQTPEAPVILPANGAGFTVIVFVTVADPHELVTTYLMVSIPGVTPVTTPPDMVAVALLLLHTPPVALSVRVTGKPVHTIAAPEMIPASGTSLIFMVFVAMSIPQILETAYIMVSVPAATLVTTPPETVADVLLLLQAPPVTTSVKVMAEPTHKPDKPVMLPASGNALMVMV
jgi:hypothetical protein